MKKYFVTIWDESNKIAWVYKNAESKEDAELAAEFAFIARYPNIKFTHAVTEETAEEITEPTAEQEEEKENEPMTTTYNITYNAQYDSHEVTFESKPATAVLDALKALKMRWNPKKACWYGFAKEHEIISAILNNGEGETITGEKTEGATVYTDGYLGGGAVYGSKSNLHLYGADLSKAIREDIKRAGIKGVSVRCKRHTGGQSVGVTVSLRPDEFVSLAEYIEKFEPGTCGDYGYIRTDSGVHRVTEREFYEASAEEQQKIRRAAAEYEYEQLTAHEASLSIYYIDKFNHFVPETHEKIKTINEIICAYRYDDSNGMVDYFDTNFYYDIYTKPAAVKPTTPDVEPSKPTKDEPKEEPAAEETAPVLRAVQAQEAESVVEPAETHTPYARYQVIMSQCFSADHEEDIITAGVCYDNLPESRCTAIGVIGEYDASAIFDGKTGKIIEITSGFPYWRIYSTGSAPAEEPATICRIDENGHDIIVKRVGDDCYTVEYCEDGKRLGEVEENCTAEYIDFRYGIIVNPEHNIQNQPTPASTPAEPIPESAGDAPEEAPETVGFHPIINNLPKKSKWDVWNVYPDEYLSSCVVPLVRCDENYHVLDTVFLKVDTPEEVKTLMSAAAVGNRRRWPKYNKPYRRETVQRAADIIEKYYI